MAKARANDIDERVGDIPEGVRSDRSGQDPSALVAEARRILEEEYDYDRAWELLKLSAVRGDGRWDAVEPLARFLVEEYAQFEPALRLLETDAWDGVPEARRLQAQAYYHLGRRDEAITLYEEVAPHIGDATMWLRIGTIRQEMESHDQAVAAFLKAEALDPSLARAGERRRKSEATVQARTGPVLAEAGGLLDAGNAAEAAVAFAVLDGLVWAPAEVGRLRRRIDDALKLGNLAALLDRASGLEEAGDHGAAMGAYREALVMDGACSLARERIDALERGAAAARAAALVAKGDGHLAAGHETRAVEVWYRGITEASRHGAPLPETAAPDGGDLFTLLRDFVAETERFVGDAQADALVALRTARSRIDAGALDAAARLHRAAQTLDGFSVYRDVGSAIAAVSRAQELRAARRLAEEAASLAEAGDRAGALERYRRAQAAGLDGLETTIEALDGHLRSAEGRAALLITARRLRDGGDQFGLLRHLRSQPTLMDEAPETRDWAAEARKALAARFPFPIEKPEAGILGAEGRFSSRDACISDLVPREARVFPSQTRNAAFLQQGKRLSMVDLDELRLAWTAELPNEAIPSGEGASFLISRLPDGEDLFACFDRTADTLALFTHFRGQLEMLNLLQPSRFLRESKEKLLVNFTLDGSERSLVVLETPQGRAGPTRVAGISLEDGSRLFENEHSYGLYHLARLPWREAAYRVNRVFDPRGFRRPGFFTWGVMDGRGRITDRFHVPPDNVEGAFLEGITFLQESPTSGRFYFFSRFIEPYTGQVVRSPPAFVAMEPDGSIYYSVMDGNALLRDKAEVQGSLYLVTTPAGERLLVPYKKRAHHFIGIFDAVDLQPLHRIELESSADGLSILVNRDRTAAWVYALFDGGELFSIRKLDAAAGKIIG
ncbi:MAG: tetratricopeptide repeat protein [Pseudomonadota bacterium]